MPRNKTKPDPIPEHFDSIEAAAEFWDTHSLADYWDQTREVEFDVDIDEEPRYVALDPELAQIINGLARTRNISPETLVNLWLREMVVRSEPHSVS